MQEKPIKLKRLDKIHNFVNKYFDICEKAGRPLNGLDRAKMIAHFTSDEMIDIYSDMLEMMEIINEYDRQSREADETIKRLLQQQKSAVKQDTRVIDGTGAVIFDSRVYSGSSGE